MSILDKKIIVIKVGSALIAPNNNGCSSHNLLAIAQFVIKCRERDQQVVLVSSGSVAAGRKWFSETEMTLALKRAMAASGQADMIETWDKLFDFPTAQLLLTNDDLCQKERFDSIRDTISTLLDNNVLPIVNENDTVTNKERRVGDNDNLAAMIATSIDADVLIMCTDVSGLYDKNPHRHADAKKLTIVEDVNDEIFEMAGGAISAQGTGGMRTKIEAAEKATSHGIDTYVIDGFNANSFEQLLSGVNPGTLFKATPKPLPAGLHWMTHTVKECGEVVISAPKQDDDKFEHALTGDRVLAVNGEFSVGDTILLRDHEGKNVAKATANYSSCLLNYLADKEIRSKLNEDSKLLSQSIVSQKHMAVLEVS